jgi:uncharacterized protein (DUF488 family)
MFTFGYEGLTIEAFIERIQEVGIEWVVDVRELPLSRKKGFSKSAFREALAMANIGYSHRPSLGCPKPVRDRYKSDRDWDAYSQGFLGHLVNQQSAVAELASDACARRACLVCFEADFSFCHRTFVARAAYAVGGPPVQHLTARTMAADAPARLAA